MFERTPCVGDHEWGPVETSRLAGTPFRHCKNCFFVSLDLNDDPDYDDEEETKDGA